MNSIRKNHFFVSIILFTVTGVLRAQTDVNYDPKAKTILDDVSKTAKAYTSITSSFTVTSKDASGKSETHKGSAVISGSKYRLIVETTESGVVYKNEYDNDGTTTWVFTEKAGELVIDNADAGVVSNDAISPVNIFTFYQKGFKYKFVEEKTVGGKVLQYIELYPEKPGTKKYHTIKLTIDKVKKQIISVAMMNNDGTSLTYDITTLTPNLAVTDATFQFDQKSHVVKTTIDQR